MDGVKCAEGDALGKTGYTFIPCVATGTTVRIILDHSARGGANHLNLQYVGVDGRLVG